jgi:methyl-accepting chemotaxis protein
MDCKKAIEAHVQWKSKLAAYFAKPDHSVNAATLAMDNQCELGKWLAGEGRKHASWPGFAKLVTEHASFHKAAAELVKRADTGQKVDQEIALGAKSDYASVSSAVVSSLMRMHRDLKL